MRPIFGSTSEEERRQDDMAQAVLEARKVTRTFASRSGGRPVDAVAGVSLAVRPGELVAIAGPSGSGKTTLLHLLAAIDTPTSGEVWIDGQEVSRLSRGARADLRLSRVGLVFSQHNLSPALTVAENVDLPLALRRLPMVDRVRRVASALDRVAAGTLGTRFPEALSSGEQQRVAIARAVAGDPRALIADEPTAYLDSRAAELLLDLLRELVIERRMAVVVATHDARMVERATRVVRLRDGTVESEEH